MNLSERLNDDMKQAMKNQDKFRLSTIRMIRAAVKNLEIDLKRPLEDSEVLDILGREVKQRKDSLQEFSKAGRDDLVADLTAEIEIISQYLPDQLTEEEIKAIVQQTIQELGASSKAEMGKVMGALLPKTKGRADGKLVNQYVQQFLQ
ncbi:GatB/YqeY domain-containing protein [Paenibacillus sp. NEAU-GSW1]|uniref:GatB/YqeY domain-containing protein n=1 Tax=Paenibacillus sp. NEAU-GSW1 TaxID=2682486 RepID=UPI0012E27C03|nr:GatB/YqeY domain-containing protein [Paenibacillus sp. NEAU-GSW1]MUT66669.1 GatB/YqeY domain-containing protein [Paenibacillus sp. NEAU-GSW1]